MMLRKNHFFLGSVQSSEFPPWGAGCWHWWNGAPGGEGVRQCESSCISGMNGVFLGSLYWLSADLGVLPTAYSELCFAIPKWDCSALSLVGFISSTGVSSRKRFVNVHSFCLRQGRWDDVHDQLLQDLKDLHFHLQNHRVGPCLAGKVTENVCSVFVGLGPLGFPISHSDDVSHFPVNLSILSNTSLIEASYFSVSRCICGHMFAMSGLNWYFPVISRSEETVIYLCY